MDVFDLAGYLLPTYKLNKMKLIAIVFAFIIYIPASNAQLKATPVCPTFSIDVLEGIVSNKLNCNSTSAEVQKLFPCFTGVVEETNGTTCGGVFYNDKDIYFYTERDYVEIREKFKGVLEPAIMGVNRSQLFKLLGNPKMKDAAWEAYQTRYGTLIIYFDANSKINKIQMSTKPTDSIKLCD